LANTDEEMLAELKRIRELLEPKPAPAPPKGILQEFKAFMAEYKVLGLAVAFILGVYLGGLVKALVSDLILPIIQLALPSLSGSINNATIGPFGVGDFANSVITFLIVAAVIFLIVKLSKRANLK